MNKYMYRASAARGFSLVELMIALLIGLVISIGVVQIFSATRATYQLDESLARAQENGRFALEFLTQDIRHAGYVGCLRDTSFGGKDDNKNIINNLASSADPKPGFSGIEGAEYSGTGFGNSYTLASTPANTASGWVPALTGVTGAAADVALPGTDVLVLRHMVPNSWALVAPYITPLNVFIDPAFASEVKSGDVMLVADCRDAVIFMVTGITPTGMISHTASATTNRCASWTQGGLNTDNDDVSCTAAFDSDNIEPTTAFGKLETVIFFVANDPTSDPANPRPTLFRRVMLATGDIVETTALVEGVENFQVLYGVDDMPPPPDNDGAADRYVTADNVGDFARVVSVQIGLLVYGVNATGTASDTGFDTDTHDVAGTSVVPAANSRRKRRVFNTTIQLRNRGI
jgi:type IV pilus assembly protein PilW